MPKNSIVTGARLLGLAAVLGLSSGTAGADDHGKFRVGIVTFLSGAASGPFGIPSRDAAQLTIEALNAGRVPAPYNSKGIGGMEIEPVIVDEAGGGTKQVEEFRNLVQRHEVDAVIGYVSSGDCLAIAPVAEELRALTVFYDCGTPRVFEENDYRYVFRTGPVATIDSVGAARYLVDTAPDIERYAGINQNYAWGKDSWDDFSGAMKQLMPEAEVVSEQFPKIFQGQYGAEISALSVAQPDVIHSSFWGGDTEAFVLQGQARGLFDNRTLLLSAGEASMARLGEQAPKGMVVGGRGPYGAFAPDNALNRWFSEQYQERYGIAPTYPASKMVDAILGLKAAVEKAQAAGKQRPGTEQIIDAFEGMSYAATSGTVEMGAGKGHQARHSVAYGVYEHDGETGRLVNVRRYSADCVTPPDGMTSREWIEKGLPGAQCD